MSAQGLQSLEASVATAQGGKGEDVRCGQRSYAGAVFRVWGHRTLASILSKSVVTS